MEEADAVRIRNRLDVELQCAGANVGIAFGLKLFDEFDKRNWLTLETFGIFGANFFPARMPAYDRTHCAFRTWDLANLDFRVGKDEKRPANVP